MRWSSTSLVFFIVVSAIAGWPQSSEFERSPRIEGQPKAKPILSQAYMQHRQLAPTKLHDNNSIQLGSDNYSVKNEFILS